QKCRARGTSHPSFLIRCHTRDLIRLMSASFLRRPEIPSDSHPTEASHSGWPCGSSRPGSSPGRDIGKVTKFIGAGTHSWGGWFRGWHGTVFGSLVIGYAQNPSLKQKLYSYAILGFSLSEALRVFCLVVDFLILFAM
uniref:ATPase protein 9 n=1 Tax=Lynx canadensis TaxID=61383 RepID=A0A667HZY6_LYNCA